MIAIGWRQAKHSFWIGGICILAFYGFGYLFGFVGLLIAIPLAAAVGVLLRFALAEYLASPLYTDRPRGGGQ